MPHSSPKEPSYGPDPTRLHPPGASDADAFARNCRRCGACAKACLPGAIFLDDRPAIIALRQPCTLCPDQPCAHSCPSGAMKPTAPAAVKMGVAVWSRMRCLLGAGDKCDLCLKACPTQAIALDKGRVIVDGDRCAGCGLCEFHCPAKPRAIYVDPL